jgi:hypothetical protein
MTALAQAPTLFDPAPSLFDEVGGEPTLDDLLSGAWEGLTAHKTVACPVCGDAMAPESGSHGLPAAGACRGCGSRLD